MNGQKHTYRYAAICIISELYFRQFCRAFGLREIIVMLIILICYSARLRLQISVIKPLHLQRYNFFLTYTKKICTLYADLMIFFFSSRPDESIVSLAITFLYTKNPIRFAHFGKILYLCTRKTNSHETHTCYSYLLIFFCKITAIF